MTDKQPEALRLADALDYYRQYDMSVTHTGIDEQTATLLRTQHAAIERKDALLRQCLDALETDDWLKKLNASGDITKELAK